jgi:hypothetical protein
MTPLAPPRLAEYLLRRYLSHNEPLAGDLLEEFDRRQSRLWFWWQVIGALVVTTFRRPEEVRPLRLVDERITPLVPRPSASMPGRIGVNGGTILTASPIRGIGGLGIAAFLLIMTLIRPATWWLALLAVAAGLVFGAIRIIYMRRRSAMEEHNRTHVLMGR